MKKLLFFIFSLPAFSATYYVANNGSDSASGTSIAAPWLTVNKVNTTATTGDTVLFRCGDQWREQITVPASTTTFGSYGSCVNLPIINGADLKTWTNTTGNIWTTTVAEDPFHIQFASGTGIKEASAAAVNATNEWFWDDPTNTLTIFHVGSPASSVEVPTREYGIVSQVGGSPKNTVTVRGLRFKNARYYNLKNSSGNTWVVDNCIFERSGHGGVVFELVSDVTVKDSTIRYSNQLGASAFHEALTLQGVTTFLVTRNVLNNNGEDGIDAKYNASNGVISNNTVFLNGTGPSIYIDAAHDIVVSDNYIFNSAVNDKAGIGLAIEDGANPSEYDLYNITVTRNIITDHAAGIWFWVEPGAETFANIDNVKIINNTIVNNNRTNWGGIFIFGDGTTTNYGTGLEIRNNIIFHNAVNSGAKEIRDAGAGSVVGDFTITHNLFETGSPTDATGTNSISTASVQFYQNEFAIKSTSPARNAGTIVSGIGQIVNEGTPDIGAKEFFTVFVANGPGGCYVTGVTNASPPVLTCQADPGWTSGQSIRPINLVAGSVDHPANRNLYVNRLTATTYSLYTDAARTVPLVAPGVFNSHAAIKFAVAVSEYVPDLERPRLYKKSFIENLRFDVARGNLTNISVTGGVATANFARTATYPHIFKVGGGVGVWGSATALLNTETGVVTAVTSNTIQWNTGAPNGTYTDAAVSAYAFSGNPGWQGIKTYCSNYTNFDQPENTEGYSSKYHACALVYYVDRSNTTARDRALWVLSNAISQIAQGNSHCGEASFDYCTNLDNKVDYARLFTPPVARVYDLFKTIPGAISVPVEIIIKNQMLTDRDTDPGCVNDPFVAQTGTVSASGTTLTGVGTNFTSFAVGGAIFLTPVRTVPYQYRQDEDSYRIVSIASDTSLTLNKSVTFSSGASTDIVGPGWSYYRPWQTGDCALKFLANHHNVNTTGNPILHPPVSNQFTGDWFISNLSITGAYGGISMGLAFLGEDARAERVVADNYGLLKHFQLAVSKSVMGDATPMGSQYGNFGRAAYLPFIVETMRSVFPTLNHQDGYWLASMTRINPWGYNGASWTTDNFHASYTGEYSSGRPNSSVAESTEASLYASEDDARTWQAMVARYCGVAAPANVPYTCFPNGNGLTMDQFFMGWNPQLHTVPLDLTTIPKARINLVSSAGGCEGLNCQTSGTMNEIVSRKNWDVTPVVNWHFCSGPSYNDHYSPCQGHKWLQTGIFANPTLGRMPFIGTDFDNGTTTGNYDNSSYLNVGGYFRSVSGGLAPITHSGVTNDVFWVGIDTKDAWTVPSGLTKAYKRFVRFTPTSGADLLFEDSDVVTPTATTIRDFTHFTPNGQTDEVNTTCAGSACPVGSQITGNIWSNTATHLVIMNTVFPDGNAIRKIDLANGSYSGTYGNTFRLTACASTDSVNCSSSATTFRAISAYYVGLVADSTAMTTTSRSVTNWRGATVTYGGNNATVMFANTDQNSMSGVTLSAGKFFAMGLNPGTYDVLLDGTPIADNVSVTATGRALFVASHGAGVLSIVQDGAPAAVDITTSSPLPDGTVGAAYSQNLTATGCVGSCTWTLQSGTLCGLTLSSAGLLSGTPVTSGVCTFVPQATDTLGTFDLTPPTLQITIQPAGPLGYGRNGRSSTRGKF